MSIELLWEHPLFRGLEAEHFETLKSNVRPLSLEQGEFLAQQGQVTRGPLYLVLEGEVDILKIDDDGGEHMITSFSAPTVIGELEFLAEVESAASVRAKSQLSGFVLPRSRFEALFDAENAAAYALAMAIGKMVSERLAHTNKLLARALSRLSGSPSKEGSGAAAADLDAIDAELSALLEN